MTDLSIADRTFDKLSDDITKFDPTDGTAITYVGKNSNPDAGDDDLNWVIKKFYYSGENITHIIKKRGSWTNRASLFT